MSIREPGSPEWELEVAQQDYRIDAQRVREIEHQLQGALRAARDSWHRMVEARTAVHGG